MVTSSPSQQREASAAFELKGAVSTLTVIRLLSHVLEQIDHELAAKVGQLPQFFLNAPVVVDVEALGDDVKGLAFAPLVALLRRHRLVPVAIRNAAEDVQQRAVAAGLGVLKGGLSARPSQSKGDSRPQAVAPAESQGRPTEAPAASAAGDELEMPACGGMVVRQPVRGGKIVYAQQCDLVALASINAGGEVIADGNIHVYGPLRGRALAGAHGNERARIFCRSLEAELVSVAGRYLRAEDIPAELRGKPAQVFLESRQIAVRPL